MLEFKGIRVNVFDHTRVVWRNGYELPNFSFDLDTFWLNLQCLNDDVNNNLVIKMDMALNSVMMYDQAIQTYNSTTPG